MLTMKRQGAKARISVSSEDDASVWGPILTRVAFAMTLMLLLARATMSEALRGETDVVPSSMAAPLGPGAATTLLFDALCLLPALLVLGRTVADRRYMLRGSWSHLLLAMLAVWSACSVAWSSDKFAALVASANTIALASLVWSTTQLVRSWLRLRIVVGLCFALLLIYAARGGFDRFVDPKDNAKFWTQNEEQILRDRGWKPGSFEAEQFKRKFIGGEIIGFNQSPNSFAAVIVMMLVASAGVAIQRRVYRDAPIWSALIVLGCAGAIVVLVFTQSRTAIGTLALACAALSLLASSRLRNWLVAHRKLAFTSGCAIVLLGAVAVVGHGLYHGSLPNASLNFRWRYWTASARLIADHPLVGVGWGNFGPHYLAYRVPAATEELRDPHNFIVRAFAELGLIGGVLVLAWLVRSAWEATRPTAPTPAKEKPSTPVELTTIGVILVGGIGLNMLSAIDWTQSGAFLILESFRRLLYLGLATVAMVAVTVTGSRRSQEIDDRPGEWMLQAAVVALGAFFVHTMMDFVLAEPGAMTLFGVLLGSVLGVRSPTVAPTTRRRGLAIGTLIGATVAWLVAIFAIVIPVAEAEQSAHDGDDAIRRAQFDRASGSFRSAFERVGYNADYAFRASRALMFLGDAAQARAMLDVAIAEDPSNGTYFRSRAGLEMRQSTPDASAVKTDYERVLALDPQNVDARIEFAEVLEKLNDPAGAVEQYKLALATNAKYDATEPERLPAERVSAIEQKIRDLSR